MDGGICLLNDLTGKKFGRLTVLKRAENTKYGKSQWECLCDCGTQKTIIGSSLTQGKTHSCGCLMREKATTLIAEARSKIKTKSRFAPGYSRRGPLYHLYSIWCNMKHRCNNPNNRVFYRYGGRGIRYAPEWEEFDSFAKWALENGYKDGLSLDRIDNDGNYSPENCQWLTRQDNARKGSKKL